MYLRLYLVLLVGTTFLMKNVSGSQYYNLIFPRESSTDKVMLTPQKEMTFKSFTLCLRAFTDLTRPHSLFSYATHTASNELLLLARTKEKYELYIGDSSVTFKAINVKQAWNHICVTWDSNTGLAVLWINGVRSIKQILSKGYTIKSGGIIVLGQEQDKLGGGFNADQSFVGELNDVNLWDRVLCPQEVMHKAAGNIIDWDKVKLTKTGDVVLEEVTEPCIIHVGG